MDSTTWIKSANGANWTEEFGVGVQRPKIISHTAGSVTAFGSGALLRQALLRHLGVACPVDRTGAPKSLGHNRLAPVASDVEAVRRRLGGPPRPRGVGRLVWGMGRASHQTYRNIR